MVRQISTGVVLALLATVEKAPAQSVSELFGLNKSLKGASPLWVVAGVGSTNDPAAERLLAANGIKTDLLQTRVELRLRSVGVPIVSTKELPTKTTRTGCHLHSWSG